MWHEARRQERKIRGMLVDYRRRAERRRDFYEKIKADPTQFLQVHGRQCKIHLDAAIAAAAEGAGTMMPWQGQSDNLIDRFDVRAHLDFIPTVKKDESEEISNEERQLNYERYRIIAQNSFLGLSEEKFLKQLHLEEQFGYTEHSKSSKKDKTGGAAIGFNYEDGTAPSVAAPSQESENDSEHSDSDLDVDLAINVSKIDPSEANEMNRHGRSYGMSSNDFYSFLYNDLEEAETFRVLKEEEHEKSLFSGRKSRRERRAHREKRLANRVLSPPSYAARESPTYNLRESKSASKSPSPENAGKITYITSFGDEEETPSTSKPTYADKVKMGKPKRKSVERVVFKKATRTADRIPSSRRKYSSSRSRSRSSSRRRKGRSSSKERHKSRSKSKSYSPKRSSFKSTTSTSSSSSRTSKSRSKSKSLSKSRSKSRSKSKSASPKRKSFPKEHSRSPPPPPTILPRYYGRKRSDESSSELSASSDDDRSNGNGGTDRSGAYGKSGASFKRSVPVNMTIQERLKRKRQALLNKQFKADKQAEQIKTEREKQEAQNREEELRDMAIKLRKRQREYRHANDSHSSSSDSNSQKSSPSRERSRKSKSSSISPPGCSPKPEKRARRERSTSRGSSRRTDERRRSPERDRRSYDTRRSPRRSPPRRYDEKRTVYRGDRENRSRERHNYDRRDDWRRGGEQREEERRGGDRRGFRERSNDRERRRDDRSGARVRSLVDY